MLYVHLLICRWLSMFLCGFVCAYMSKDRSSNHCTYLTGSLTDLGMIKLARKRGH